MTPLGWAIVADAIVAGHAVYVLAVIAGLAAIVIGGMIGARWTRKFWLRAAHLAMIAIVCAESALGEICPLTIWENAARMRAGVGGYTGDFVAHALDAMIFYNAPQWVFTAGYFAFGAVVLATWFIYPVDWPLRLRGRNNRISRGGRAYGNGIKA